MSYCTLGPDSDVYVYESFDAVDHSRIPIWVCSQCRLQDGSRDFWARTRPEMIAHFQAHELRGHRVPSSARDRLLREIVAPPCAYWQELADYFFTGPPRPQLSAPCQRCALCKRMAAGLPR
jgi:hypothetical protein